MLLAKMRNMRIRANSEDGIAIIAVVAIMLIGMVVLAIVTGVLTYSTMFSSADKADAQSQISADSGLAASVAGLNQKACPANATFSNLGNPKYSATIWRSTDGVTFIKGCPNTTTQQVRIISTGYPAVGTIGGVGLGNVKYVEGTYLYSPNGGNTTGVAANYVYNIGALDTYTIDAVSGGNADIMVKTGDYSCTGPTTINGNVSVAAGKATLTNTCTVSGTVWATGNIALTVQSGINANAISTGGGVSLGNTTSYINGSVFANGLVSTNGIIGGDIQTTGDVTTVAGSSTAGNIWSGGNVTIGQSYGGAIQAIGQVTLSTGIQFTGTIKTNGTFKYRNKTNLTAINNAVTDGVLTSASQVTCYNAACGVVAPPVQATPTIPAWSDVFYNYSDWQALGFGLVTWPSASTCGSGDATFQQLVNATTPIVVDARGCTNFSGSVTLALKTDIAIFGPKFSFTTLNVTSADNAFHRIWFIVPEVGSPTGSPICPQPGNTGNIVVSNAPSAIGPNVSATAYTPCNIATNNGTNWEGLLYSGGMNGGGGLRQLHFVPIGIPGTTVGNGNINPNTNYVGALVVKRNRTNNGE